MNKVVYGLAISSFIALAGQASAVTFSVDPSASWIGYMNVFNLPQDGGAFQFGGLWGTADLTATWAGPTLTLGTNNIGDPNSYWYIGGGMAGAQGNKIMDANMYVQIPDGTLAGETLTFTGNVTSNSLFGHTDSLGNGWTSVAFIKDFVADYSSFTITTVPLNAGVFSISHVLSSDSTHHFQYGFETVGSCVWATDAPLFGNIQLQAVPEPTTMAALGLGALAMVRRRRASR